MQRDEETVSGQIKRVGPPRLLSFILTPCAFLATHHRGEAIARIRMEIIVALEQQGITKTAQLLALTHDELLTILGSTQRADDVVKCLESHGLHLSAIRNN